jgi:hypothetical protein
MAEVGLNDITFFDEDLDREFRRRREMIEASRNWAITGAQYNQTPAGQTLFIPGNRSHGRHAVVMSPGISAAPDADTLGSGPIMLRKRDGNALTDDVTGVCRINFTTAIPTGTRITVVPDGDDWTIPGANCPPPP